MTNLRGFHELCRIEPLFSGQNLIFHKIQCPQQPLGTISVPSLEDLRNQKGTYPAIIYIYICIYVVQVHVTIHVTANTCKHCFHYCSQIAPVLLSFAPVVLFLQPKAAVTELVGRDVQALLLLEEM